MKINCQYVPELSWLNLTLSFIKNGKNKHIVTQLIIGRFIVSLIHDKSIKSFGLARVLFD